MSFPYLRSFNVFLLPISQNTNSLEWHTKFFTIGPWFIFQALHLIQRLETLTRSELQIFIFVLSSYSIFLNEKILHNNLMSSSFEKLKDLTIMGLHFLMEIMSWTWKVRLVLHILSLFKCSVAHLTTVPRQAHLDSSMLAGSWSSLIHSSSHHWLFPHGISSKKSYESVFVYIVIFILNA